MTHAIVVVPWHNKEQIDAFVDQWQITQDDRRVLLQHDESRDGCAKTKNKGVRKAIDRGAKVVIVLDDDCFPVEGQTLEKLIDDHLLALMPQQVEMFEAVTVPPSRGTPYFSRSIKMQVAASMGFWTHVGDYDAVSQLVHGATCPMKFSRKAIFGKYFPLCGMNLAFRASEWPWCQFVDVPRFDDIWQGFIWQKQAYKERKCFNLAGPIVKHSRQSNVWKNLLDESINLQRNETIWQDVHNSTSETYEKILVELDLSV